MGGSLADFISRVVPWPLPGDEGVINMHWTHPSHAGMGGKPFVQLSEFLAMVPWCNSHAGFVKDVYYCLSRQRMVGPMRNGKASALRNAGNATHLKAIWCDIDANKLPPNGYVNKDDAFDAILKFLADAGMPPPSALVDSGNGYHVYWISKTALTVEEWRPYAEGLWALMQKHGLHGDPLTTDSVRVLRVPETFNNKQAPAKPVVLKLLGDMYDFAVDLKFVGETAPVQRVLLLSGNGNRAGIMLDPKLFPPLTPITDESQILAVDCQPKEMPPLDAFSVIEKCPHYLHELQTGGAATNQGLWMQTILGATWFDNGEKIARALGNRHPGYSKESTQAMFDRKLQDREERGLGWPSCRTFENNGSTKCVTCQYRGKIKSPLNLGTPIVSTTTAAVAATANFSVPPPPAGAVDLRLPDGFMINANGFLVFVKESPVDDTGKQAQSKEIQLLKCKLIGAPWAEKGKNGHILRFHVTADKGFIADIAVPLEATHTTTALCLCLSQQGCKIAPKGKEYLGDFMVSWLQILHEADEALYAVPLGWWEHGGDPHAGFAYGGRTIKANGTSGHAGSLGSLEKIYSPIGTIQPWFDALKLITNQHRPALEAIVASSFASPLMSFTGQYAGAICGHSSASGNNKSSAVKVGLAVWGHPRLTKQVSDSSHKGLLKTLGDIRNLPSMSDDISDPDVMDACVLTVQSTTQGVGGIKLFQNRKPQPREEWDSLMVITSNRSMFDTMLNKIKDTKAAVNRVFEFDVPDVKRDANNVPIPGQPGWLPEGEAEPIFQKLEQNYGRIGEKYAAMLGGDPQGVGAVVKAYNDYFRKKCKATGEERFWLAICATTMAGAHLANTIGASFNLDELKQFMVDNYFAMRTRTDSSFLSGGSYEATTAALTAFLIEFGNRSLRTTDMPMPAKRGKPTKLQELSGPRDFHQAEVRMHWVINDRVLRIGKEKFVEFLNRTKRSPSTVMAGLADHYQMWRPAPILDMTAGTTYQGGPEALIVLPIPPGHWLENGLFARTPLDQIAVTQPGQSTVQTGLAPTGAAPPAPSPGP